MPIRTYKYRIYPSKSQEGRLRYILESARLVYNNLLEAQKITYAEERRFLTYAELSRKATKLKKPLNGVHAHIVQTTAKRLSLAFSKFFDRKRSKKRGGFPRFKGKDRFKSFSFKQYGNGFKIRGRRLYISGVGNVHVRWHRELPTQPKTLTVKKYPDGWYVSFAVEIAASKTLASDEPKPEIGADFGTKSYLTLSTGESIQNPKHYEKELDSIRRLQQQLSKKKKGSNRYKRGKKALRKKYQKLHNQVNDWLHKLSRELVDKYSAVVLEDLSVPSLAKVAPNKTLRRAIIFSNFYNFVEKLKYKAEEAGTEVILVDPAYTSKTCSHCGHINRSLQLSDSVLVCEVCGTKMNRDHNAALNILRAGRALRQPRREAARL